MDDLNDLKSRLQTAMRKNDLIWDQQPTWSTAPLVEAANGAVSTIQIISGRLLSTVSGRTEFIGPHTDEGKFWTQATYLALDTEWDQPHAAGED